MIFLVVNFCQYFGKKEYFAINSPFFEKKNLPEKELKKFWPKILTTAQLEMVLKIFLLSYFEICQIWLNIVMDDCHFEQHQKIEKENTGFVDCWAIF